jgi:hypothetical protein
MSNQSKFREISYVTYQMHLNIIFVRPPLKVLCKSEIEVPFISTLSLHQKTNVHDKCTNGRGRRMVNKAEQHGRIG